MKSLNDYHPSDDSDLTSEESEILDFVFGSDEECEKCSSSSDSYSNSKSSDSYSKDKKKKSRPYYDCSYTTIIFVIILTLIFILLANPATAMWFGYYVPDPYFNLLTRALIFFIIVFIVDILLSYYWYDEDDDGKEKRRKH